MGSTQGDEDCECVPGSLVFSVEASETKFESEIEEFGDSGRLMISPCGI